MRLGGLVYQLVMIIFIHQFFQFHWTRGQDHPEKLSSRLSKSATLSESVTLNKYFESTHSRHKGELRFGPESNSLKLQSVVVESSSIAPNTTNNASTINVGGDASIYPTLIKPLFRPIFTSIAHEERNVHHYFFNSSVLLRWPAFQLQLYAETDQYLENSTDTYRNPLVVTAYWMNSIKSWKIPIVFINGTHDDNVNRYSDNSVGKTIWRYYERRAFTGNSENLTVEVSSFSVTNVYYKLKIVVLKDFIVPLSSSIITTATPTTPAFYKFHIPEGWENVFIHAVSDSDVCATMTVEYLKGPFLDMEENLEKVQLLETFTRKTGMTVEAENFTQGFLLAFSPFLNDEKCAKKSSSSASVNDEFRKKVITFQIREGPSSKAYITPTFFPLLLFVLITVFVFALMVVFHNIRHHEVSNGENSLIQRCLSQFTSNITINDLIVTEPSRVVDQSRRYCTAGFVTSAFYSVPVFQLIFTFRKLLDTGNLDLCYFNHFCSHMILTFHDFNHMYSNIWYILFGLVYILMVRIRQLSFDLQYTNNETEQRKKKVFLFFRRADGRMDRGVMTHYGLLYCMGYALIMTGVMSAVYHICPNQRNFQFDTVFMYTIAAITVVTLYQARHPTYLSANFTFTALALVTVITVLGLLWEDFYVRVIFSVVHMLFLVLSLPKVFYSGFIRKNDRLVVNWEDVMKIWFIKMKDDLRKHQVLKIQRNTWYSPNNCGTIIIPGPGRVILPGFLLLINCCAIAAMWTLLSEQNFATQVLFICVFNGALYIIFYSILKLFHGECRRVLWIQPFIYLMASFALWGTAMSFFLDEVSTWESSPAESRLKNMDCIFLSFYDSHDMWHFLSAAALFFSAMVLLTVDDDLVDQPKSTIPVF